MKISIIIPCYNEEASVIEVVKSIPRQASEIIVVDNNSQDRTSEKAKSAGARVVFELKPGYGRAIQAGFKQASGEIFVVMDGDGQYPADMIMPMVDCLQKERLDFISGTRFPMLNPDSMNLMRKLGNWGLTFVSNMLFGFRLKDSQSGMWVFRKRILDKIKLQNEDMSFSEEIKLKCILQGLRFKEVPIPYYARAGDSKLLPFRHGLKNLLYLFKLRLNTLRIYGKR